MKKFILLCLGLALSFSTLSARDYYNYSGTNDYRNSKNVVFTSPYKNVTNKQNVKNVYNDNGVEYAEVIRSEPVYKTVVKSRPYKECWNEQVAVQVPYKTRSSSNSIGLDTIIGGVAGVALGNQFHGEKDAARVIGGIGGAMIANNMRGGTKYRTEYKTVQKCETKYDRDNEQRMIGYKNYFFLNGEEHSKISERPLERVQVKVNYSY